VIGTSRLHPATDHADRAPRRPLRYRLPYRAALWRPGERPQLIQHALEGDPGLGI